MAKTLVETLKKSVRPIGVRCTSTFAELEVDLMSESRVPEPENALDRKWAMELLARAEAALREQYAQKGRAEWFSALYPLLVKDETSMPYAELAEQLDTSLSSIKVGVHRMRKSYREKVRLEVMKTVDSEVDVDSELQELDQVLAMIL